MREPTRREHGCARSEPAFKRIEHVMAERGPLEGCEFVKTEEFCWSSTQDKLNLQAYDQA